METIGFPIEIVIPFLILVIGSLWYDLRSHKNSAVVPLRTAVKRTAFYAALALAFGAWLAVDKGPHTASLFFTGYVLEEVLSIDNLIVFTAIFSYFGIAEEHRHKVLHYGIIGAVVFRLIFVVMGTQFMGAFGKWAELIFGLIIAVTAIKMLRQDAKKVVDYRKVWYIKFVNRFFPVHAENSHKFFEKVLDNSYGPRLYMTRLFMCLLAIEVSDIIFAFDSVPAVIAVSRDPLIVYTSMIFAMLGLRSLYFVLEALRRYLVHLEKAVIMILFFIAAKLVAHATMGFKFLPHHSLAIVLGALAGGIVASLLSSKKTFTPQGD